MVAYTHILPAAFWVMAVPFQFNPWIRKNFKTFHRFLGRAFVYTSFLLMVGFVAILYRGLQFENYLEGVERMTLPVIDVPIGDVLQCVIAGYFLYTAVVAVDYAKKKDFKNHSNWMMRHVASGMWVVIQRVLLTFFAPIYLSIYGPEPRSGHFRGSVFSCAALLGIILSVGGAEYTILLLQEKKKGH